MITWREKVEITTSIKLCSTVTKQKQKGQFRGGLKDERRNSILKTVQIWVALLTGWRKIPRQHNQSEALPRCIIRMEFLQSFLRCHFLGKAVVSNSSPPNPHPLLQNCDCFLRLSKTLQVYILTWWWNVFVTDINMYEGYYKWLILYSVGLQVVQQR